MAERSSSISSEAVGALERPAGRPPPKRPALGARSLEAEPEGQRRLLAPAKRACQPLTVRIPTINVPKPREGDR